MKLIYIPFPLQHESPTSMLKRLALKHGCTHSSEFARLINFKEWRHVDCVRDRSIVSDIIAEHAGKFAGKFRSGFYLSGKDSPNRRFVMIAGTKVPSALVQGQSTAFCSECWEGGTEKFIKDLKTSLHYPYHNRRYLTCCPECSRRLDILTPLTDRCDCGHKLVSPRCSANECRLEKVMLQWILEGESKKIFLLYSTLRQLQYPLKSLERSPLKAIMLDAALSVVENCPTGLVSYLKYLQQLYPDIDNKLIAAKLYTLEPSELGTIARDIFLKAAGTKASVTKPIPARPPFTLTKKQVFVLLSTSVQHLSDLTGDSRCAQICSKGYIIPLEDILYLQDLHTNYKYNQENDRTKLILSSMNRNEACARLNIDNRLLASMVQSGVITRALRRWKRLDIYFEADINKLSQTCISSHALATTYGTTVVKINNIAHNAGIVPTHEAFSTSSKLYSHDSANEIAMILQRPRRERSKVKRYRKYSSIPETEKIDLLSTGAAALLVGMSVNVLKQLMAQGLVEIAAVAVDKSFYVTRTEILKLRREVILAGEAATLLKIPLNRLTRTAISMGVKPLTGPLTDGQCITTFNRRDIELLAESMKSTNDTTMVASQHAREVLKLPYPVFHSLQKQGAFRSLTQVDFPAQGVCMEALNTFHERYVTLHRLCRYLATTYTCVSRILPRYGICPICGPSADGTRKTIYRAQDLELLGISTTTWSEHHEILPNNNFMWPDAINYINYYQTLGLSAILFNSIFVKSGFVELIEFRDSILILQQDIRRINHILDNYYIVRTPHPVYNRKQINTAIRRGLLHVVPSPDPRLVNETFISRSEIDQANIPQLYGRRTVYEP